MDEEALVDQLVAQAWHLHTLARITKEGPCVYRVTEWFSCMSHCPLIAMIYKNVFFHFFRHIMSIHIYVQYIYTYIHIFIVSGVQLTGLQTQSS